MGIALTLAALALVLPASEEDAPPTLRVILFTPADIEPPGGVERRLTLVADASEQFLARGMARWGYEPAVAKPFRRKDDGSLEVLFLKGDAPKSSGRYDKPTFAREVIDAATARDEIPGRGHVWWIFVYLGDRPTRFNEYRGSGNSADGGWAMVNYDSISGTIRPDAALAAGFNADFTLKGCLHELGHGFGLPHIGPSPGKKLGNSLMGPNMEPYYARHPGKKDGRVYLTPLAAAMLWKHPVFSGSGADRAAMPKVELAEYRPRFDRKARKVEIAGRVVADRPLHSVVILDDGEKQQGSYWSRGYAARVADDGTFQVAIEEPFSSGGLYRIFCCFDNGIVTGDGKKHGDQSAIVKPYRFVRGVPEFGD